MKLKIRNKTIKAAHVLQFEGSLDLLDSPDMPSRLLPYTKKHVGTIVVDLSTSTFVDSQWLAVFIRFDELCKAQKNLLYFLMPIDATVRDLFDSTGLTKVLRVIPSLEDIPQ